MTPERTPTSPRNPRRHGSGMVRRLGPERAVGYLMTFGYAMMLGYLRQRTKGILAPYIAHIIADTTIAGLLVYLGT
jgi:membrane protease YdiL (CAAX protease family)